MRRILFSLTVSLFALPAFAESTSTTVSSNGSNNSNNTYTTNGQVVYKNGVREETPVKAKNEIGADTSAKFDAEGKPLPKEPDANAAPAETVPVLREDSKLPSDSDMFKKP